MKLGGISLGFAKGKKKLKKAISGELKQVIVVRKDLKMSEGKMAAQTAHASLAAYIVAKKHNPDWAQQWLEEGQKKVVLSVNSDSEIIRLENQCKVESLDHYLIADAGHTELAPGTVTALAVGPAPDKFVDKLTGGLPLY